MHGPVHGDASFLWPKGLLALVPVYNHQATVGRVVQGLRRLGATVLVMDDGSNDGSGAAARAAGGEVVALDRNRGKAEALITGLHLAETRGYRQVLTCDADGQHPMEAVCILVRSATNAVDAIHIGCRNMRDAPWTSRMGRALSNFWSWVACGAWHGDSQSGLRVYPLPSTNRLKVRARRYAFEIEVLVRASWSGIAVRGTAVPVIYPQDRISHFRKIGDNLHAFGVITRLIIRRGLPWRARPLPATGLAG